MTAFNEADVVQDFAEWADSECNLEMPPDPPIGKIFYCSVKGKGKRNRDGRAKLYLDGRPAGWAQDWTDGAGARIWTYGKDSDYSPEEHKANRARIQAAQREREAENERIKMAACELSKRVWDDSADCDEHPYLAAKLVQSYGLRRTTREWSLPCRDGESVLTIPPGSLVIPAQNVHGEITTLEFILTDGTKLFLPGGQKKGSFFFIGKTTGVICIAEGYATGASVHPATGYAVVVAFDCINLLPVAEAIRAKYPDAKLLFCADDDYHREPNAGIEHGQKAARVVGGIFCPPKFGPARANGATDFNDLAVASGLEAVKACVEDALAQSTTAAEAVAPDADPRVTVGVERHPGDGQPEAAGPTAVVTPWPTMGDGAYYGPLGESARLIEPLTEADSAAVLVHLLVAFGSAVGRGPRLVIGSIRQTANLFAVIVGKSSKARKGTAWSNAREIIGPADEEWARDRVKGGLSTGEGVIHAVRDAVIAREPIREGGKKTGKIVEYQEVEVDAGESDKRLLVIEPEFARTLKAASRRESTLSPVLREAWDSGSLSTLTKCPYKATGAHVSIVGHITKDELKRELSACDSVNGYANRFLWCCARRARELPFGEKRVGDAVAPTMVRIQSAVMWARARGDDFVVSMDSGARQLWKADYSRLSADQPGLVGSVLGRAEAQVLRIALVYALADESGSVQRPHLEAALALWRFAEDSARHIFGDALGDPVADEILRVLRESSEGMTREGICDHFSRHTSASRLTEALRLLAENGLATCTKEAPSGGMGRPAERWFAVAKRREGSEASEGRGIRSATSLANLACLAPVREENTPAMRQAQNSQNPHHRAGVASGDAEEIEL